MGWKKINRKALDDLPEPQAGPQKIKVKVKSD